MAFAARGWCVALGIAVATLAVPLPAVASAPDAQDKSFMTANAQTNLAEISGATIALARSQTDTVRTLANMIMTDHKKAQSQLQGVARGAGFTLPAMPNSFQLHQAQILKTASSEQFDATYLEVQVQGHQGSISNTKSEIAHGSDATVVAYAKSYLPVAEKHLQMAGRAITAERSGPAPVASPQSRPGGATSAVVTTGPLAHGAKRKPSNDTWWLIGLAILIVLVAGGLVLRLRKSGTRKS